MIGNRIGPYEITGRIGAGGMGEVFRGRDTRIGRDVAIKVLPPEVTADADRLRRFEVEARAAGSLNHPNLVTIHEFGNHEGAPYLAMELLEGESLREKLGNVDGDAPTTRIPIRKAMEYAQQLAAGLAAAHEKGIVHRDLKPENVFLTPDGRLKILDFGLAKLGGPALPQDETAEAATQARKTTPGTILGTIGYMSPEQVRGQETDQRTDIFAFGAILYEMVSGRRAFRGTSAADTMSAILHQDPPELSASSDGQQISPIVDRVIRRCLEKEKLQRFESARDLGFALEAVTSSSMSHERMATAPPRQNRRNALLFALAALLAVVAAAAVAYRLGRSGSAPPRQSFTQLTYDAGLEHTPAIAPDGKTFVFVRGNAPSRQLFLQRVDGRSAIPLSKSPEDDDYQPAFSPDGSQIAFRSERDGGGIFVMGATGESVRRLSSSGFNPSWSPDGKEIVVASESMISATSRNSVSSLSVIDVATGTVRPLFAGDAMQPRFSPNRKRIAYWALPPNGSQRDLYTIDVSGDPKTVVPLTNDAALDFDPVWAPDGKSLFFASDRGGTLNVWEIGVDEESGEPRGEPRPLSVPAGWAAHLSLSRDGRQMLFISRSVTEEMVRGTFDPATEKVTLDERPLLAGSMIVRDREASPDGQWIAFTNEGRQEDVYVMRADGTELRQLTNDAHRDRGVSWSPDGTHVYFYSARSGDYDAWRIRTDGSGLTQVTKQLHVNFPIPSPDGKRLAFFDLEHGRIAELGTGPATRATVLPSFPNGDGFFPRGWSPDGKRLLGTGWASRSGIHVLTLADGTIRDLTPQGAPRGDSLGHRGSLDRRGDVQWIDDRRLLLATTSGDLLVIDAESGAAHPVGNVSAVTFSRNARTFLFGERVVESDVWLMTRGESE